MACAMPCKVVAVPTAQNILSYVSVNSVTISSQPFAPNGPAPPSSIK